MAAIDYDVDDADDAVSCSAIPPLPFLCSFFRIVSFIIWLS